LPLEWRENVQHWSIMNKPAKSQISGAWIPDSNEEYFIYQTLLGVWPAGWDKTEAPSDLLIRLTQYLIKALREAKLHTSWIHNNEPYEESVLRFVEQILAGPRSKRFLRSFLLFQRRIAYFGMINSLAQTTLKIASPGVPDFYQGAEYWDLSLADPDNRRPVDFSSREAALASLERINPDPGECRSHLNELLANWPDGRVKLYVISKALQLRRKYKDLFLLGDYQSLAATREWNDFVAGFSRSYHDQHLIALVPRRFCTLVGHRRDRLQYSSAVWQDGKVNLPDELADCSFRNIFTGARLRRFFDRQPAFYLADVFREFPVAMLLSE
jgi:(1->4)-alpha-D-glucan 1-alpha-D-glucosylmutase